MRTLFLIGLSCIVFASATPYGYEHVATEKKHSKPLIEKNFYLYSAPEEHEHEVKTENIQVGHPKKDYRVVFLKAPTHGSTHIKYNIDVAPQEEKTAIYVLSKKGGEVETSAVVNEPQNKVNKPEVHFIKYKTHEEAQAVQKEIQAQYDKYGGHSKFSDEGVAPLTSVVGSLHESGEEHSHHYKHDKKHQ